MVRLQLILFSKRTGAFLFRTFGGFLHVPTTQIYCLTGAMIIETHNEYIIYLNNTTRSSTVHSMFALKISQQGHNVQDQIVLNKAFTCSLSTLQGRRSVLPWLAVMSRGAERKVGMSRPWSGPTPSSCRSLRWRSSSASSYSAYSSSCSRS